MFTRHLILALGILLFSSSLTFYSCKMGQSVDLGADEIKISQVHNDYVNGWLKMDEEKIMALLEENARIQPNKLKPIEGKSEIRKFWFPNDSSITTINDYKTEIIALDIRDTLAITTHNSILDWTYQKDSTNFGMIQKGINTTVYRKQKNGSWKIWRSMWTDIYSESK